jgi:SAM-dependent methyltransferase
MIPDFGNVAAEYKTFRPTYPAALFAYLASIAPSCNCAWDCATGNGQAACALKSYFREVVATDISERQIAQSTGFDGIEYIVASAEKTPLASSSIDLITVAQALHWFDLPRFFAEVKRVAKPGGILACWCYSLLSVDSRIDVPICKLSSEVLKGYWSSERTLVDEHYATISFPFEELAPPQFEMTQRWNLDQLLGYLGTWSAVAAYEKAIGTNPISLIADELHSAWGDRYTTKSANWTLHLRVFEVT